MSQADLLVLARQGNVEAIATLMSRKLAPVQVMVEAQLEDSCLLLQLVAHGPLPSQKTLVNFVRRGMDILKVQNITSVQASAWKAGALQPAWVEYLSLTGDASREQGAPRDKNAKKTAPQGQAFGVNLASLAASASRPPSPSLASTASASTPSPRLPFRPAPTPDRMTSEGSSPQAVSPPPAFSSAATPPHTPIAEPGWAATADPETDYRNWLLKLDSLGWWQRLQAKKLAAFLVYFLNPNEVPIDAVGASYGGKPCILLLTDQRLSCLEVGWRRMVQEYFGVWLAQMTPARQSTVTMTREGLLLRHPPTNLTAMVKWQAIAQGEQFMARSACRVIPLPIADERGERGMLDPQRSSGMGSPEWGDRNLLSMLMGGPGDRLPLLLRILLVLVPLVLVVVLISVLF